MSAQVGDLDREELAALVYGALARAGIPAVLSGAAAAAVYSGDEREPLGLDLVRTGIARRVDPVMSELGFHKRGRRWTHADTPFWIELPPGPVQAGDAIVTEFAERRTRAGALRLLAPTECVMDRLARYYDWEDAGCLAQAVAVAARHAIDLGRVRAWSEREGAGAKFERFRELLPRMAGRG